MFHWYILCLSVVVRSQGSVGGPCCLGDWHLPMVSHPYSSWMAPAAAAPPWGRRFRWLLCPERGSQERADTERQWRRPTGEPEHTWRRPGFIPVAKHLFFFFFFKLTVKPTLISKSSSYSSLSLLACYRAWTLVICVVFKGYRLF